MVSIKPLGAIAEKYVRRAGQAMGDYQTAIQQTPVTKWEVAAKAAGDAWSSGVSQAVAEGRFVAGIDGKGVKWGRKASTVGPQRYQTGVAAAGPDFTSGFQRSFDTLSALVLGPRGPRGDQRNYARSQQVGDALNKARRAAKSGR